MYRTKKRQRVMSCKSAGSAFLAPHSSFTCRLCPWNAHSYDDDVWTEIAKYLDGKSLVKLGMTNRWFRRLTMEESVWKYASLRDLQVPAARAAHCSWKQLYVSAFDGTHSYSFRQKEKHIDWMRVGAFFFDSPTALLTDKLAFPRRLPRGDENPRRAIQSCGSCILNNVKPGIWIVDLQLVRCPVCNLNTCEGTMQTLDARHAELFLQDGFKNGSWEYEDIGDRRVDKHHNSASGAIFDLKHIKAPCTAEVLDLKEWIGKPKDWQPRARIRHHGVAVNTNLQPNEGISVKYQVMRSGGEEAQAVSIRISQQLV
ncbi:hypothetical protein Taro_016264 [Colocasia esculenta]|uniref:F-box protein n=1 Tax=Colocasia esculenta TaxID=4460 RepID=A0A843UPT2_COLES|nr:hypothetical protein [Colocasia esculenta]